MNEQTSENLLINSPENVFPNLVDTLKTLQILANPRREQTNLKAVKKYIRPKP